jgi:hypothetical protein
MSKPRIYKSKSRVCVECNKRKVRSEFRVFQGKYLDSRCRPCARDRGTAQHRFRRYGIEPDEYDRRFEQQGGVCKICLRPEPVARKGLSVDHCHLTGQIRGLLCTKCNSGIGLLEDDPNLIRRALDYLNE